MASRNIKDLHIILANTYKNALIEYMKIFPKSPIPFLTCTYRTPEEQNKLYHQVPKVTNAKGGQSPHNYLPALAFDIAFISLYEKLDWNEINFTRFSNIICRQSDQIVWGGNFQSIKDLPHFELKNWKN